MSRLPIQIGDDLAVSITRTPARLTPAEGFNLAQRLIKASTRALIAESADLPIGSPPRQRARRAR